MTTTRPAKLLRRSAGPMVRSVLTVATPIKGRSPRVRVRRTGRACTTCAECNGQFTVTVGTVMERSKIPLSKWLFAMHLMGASKKGMSALQLQRMLGVTYKTAWFLCHRIREATTPTTRGPHPVPPEQPLIHEPLPFDMQIVLKRQLERCHRSASQKWEALTERRPQFMPAHLIVFESTPRIIV